MANAKKGTGSKKAVSQIKATPKKAAKATGLKLGGVPNKGR